MSRPFLRTEWYPDLKKHLHTAPPRYLSRSCQIRATFFPASRRFCRVC